MPRTSLSSWRLDRRINLSVLVQLMVLASLILGSWLNLQRQLDGLQRDVTMLLKTQEGFTEKLSLLSDRTLSHEYRLQAIEKSLAQTAFAVDSDAAVRISLSNYRDRSSPSDPVEGESQ